MVIEISHVEMWADHVVSDPFLRGGKLFISESKIVFVPHFLDKILLAKKVNISIKSISEIIIVDGPYNISDEIIFKLVDAQKHVFRVKNAEKLIIFFKKTIPELIINNQYRTNSKKGFISKSVLKDLFVTAIVVAPSIICASLFIEYVFLKGYPISNFFDPVMVNDWGIVIMVLSCQMIAILIYMIKLCQLALPFLKKISVCLVVFMTCPISIPVLHTYYLRKKITSTQKMAG